LPVSNEAAEASLDDALSKGVLRAPSNGAVKKKA
jgi:hypothetical protein